MRIATSCRQSPTNAAAEPGLVTQVPSEQLPEPKAAASPSLPKMVTVAGDTTRPAATPAMVMDSAPSASESSFTVKLRETEPPSCPAGMVIRNGLGRATVKSLPSPSSAWPEPEPPDAVSSTTTGESAGADSPTGKVAVTTTEVWAESSSSAAGAADKATTESSSYKATETGITPKVAAEPEKVTASKLSRLRSSTGDKIKSKEPLLCPAGMVIVKGPVPPSPSANVKSDPGVAELSAVDKETVTADCDRSTPSRKAAVTVKGVGPSSSVADGWLADSTMSAPSSSAMVTDGSPAARAEVVIPPRVKV